MIFITTRSIVKEILTLDNQHCEKCQSKDAIFYKRIIKAYFFIIPIASISSNYYIKCNECGYSYELVDEQIKQLKKIISKNNSK